MGFANRAFVAAGVGFAVSAIVGCGSSGGRLLSATESNRLSEQLNRVQEALTEQRCSAARQYLSEFQATVQNLGEVNPTLISNLDQGASTIQSLADSACPTQTTTTPKKTHTSTSTTRTSTQRTQTYTTPTITTYTQPTYTQTYTQPTNTTGGTCPTCGGTTATSTTTTSTDTTSSTTTPNGGTGLGGTDTSTTGTSTNPAGGGGG